MTRPVRRSKTYENRISEFREVLKRWEDAIVGVKKVKKQEVH